MRDMLLIPHSASFLFLLSSCQERRKKKDSNNTKKREPNRAIKPMIGAHGELSDHEGMHRTAGHFASKTEGTWLIGDERDCRGLARVSFDRYTITVNVQPMYDIGADELNCDGIAGVDL
jgi:hypothetical protein